MSQLVNYSIIEAGLRALADKAHESAVAQAEGKPIPCGLSEGDMELVALLTAMMNDTQANKGWCAHEMGKSISSFEKYVHDGKIPEGIHDQFGHEKKWNKSLIRYFANKKAFFHKLSRNSACGSAYFRKVFDKYVWGGSLLSAWRIGAGCHHKMSKASGHTDCRSFTKYICENID